MQRLRLIGIVAVAALAICVGTAASASAFVNPILVTPKTGANAKVTFTSKSTGSAKLTTVGGGTITCVKESSAGGLETTGTGEARETKGESKVKFNECTAATGKCKTAGDAEGEITNTVSLLLVWLNKESEKKPGVLISILPVANEFGKGEGAKVEFTCGGVPIAVEGSFCGKVSPALKTPTKTVTLEAKVESNGSQEFKKCTDNKVEKTNSLFSNTNKEGWKEAGQAVTDVQTESAEVEGIES